MQDEEENLETNEVLQLGDEVFERRLNYRLSAVNVDATVEQDRKSSADFFTLLPRGLPQDIFVQNENTVIERKLSLRLPQGVTDEGGRLPPFVPFRTSSDNDNLHLLPSQTEKEALTHFIELENATKTQKARNAALISQATKCAKDLKKQGAKVLKLDEADLVLEDASFVPKILPSMKTDLKPNPDQIPTKPVEPKTDLPATPLQKTDLLVKPEEANVDLTKLPDGGQKQVQPKPHEPKPKVNLDKPSPFVPKHKKKPTAKLISMRKPTAKSISMPKPKRQTKIVGKGDQSSSSSEESSSEDENPYMFPGMGMGFPHGMGAGQHPMMPYGGGGFPGMHMHGGGGLPGMQMPPGYPPYGGYPGGYGTPYGGMPYGGGYPGGNGMPYGGMPYGGGPPYNTGVGQYPQTQPEPPCIPAPKKEKQKKTCKKANLLKKNQGMAFDFIPHENCCTEVTLTIEPDDPGPLECAVENGIMPIVCCYMPPSLTLDPRSPLGVKTCQMSEGTPYTNSENSSYYYTNSSTSYDSYSTSSPSVTRDRKQTKKSDVSSSSNK